MALHAQVACLEARAAERSPGFNELVGSLLDALRALAPALGQGTPPETASRLLRALCALLRCGAAPLRLRTLAAAVLAALAAAALTGSGPLAAAITGALGEHCGLVLSQRMPVMPQQWSLDVKSWACWMQGRRWVNCWLGVRAGNSESRLLHGLVSLLLLRVEEAGQGVMGEARGECGPPEVPVQAVTPEALEQAATVAQAEAVAAAAQVQLGPPPNCIVIGGVAYFR
jgi:hypothetical protein